MLANRAAWELTNGRIPDGMLVCHRCDNPACVNPDHLWLGTNADNMRDKEAKGRGSHPPVRRGEKNNKTKLTAEEVAAIRAAPKEYQICAKLARQYGVTRKHVSVIRRRHRVWLHM